MKKEKDKEKKENNLRFATLLSIIIIPYNKGNKEFSKL
jgi:hypothetical protein